MAWVLSPTTRSSRTRTNASTAPIAPTWSSPCMSVCIVAAELRFPDQLGNVGANAGCQ